MNFVLHSSGEVKVKVKVKVGWALLPAFLPLLMYTMREAEGRKGGGAEGRRTKKPGFLFA
ncbi:hypothetical protein AM228_20775 [Planktothricoides sp. SR001]|nr:hypothetical protein AM228_20775 [Planktothricoides sp. SR001]